MGAIAVAIRMRPPLARVGALFRCLRIVLHVDHAVVTVADSFLLPDDVSVLGILQPVCGGLAHRENDFALCPEGAICRSPLGLRHTCVAGVALIPLFHAEVSRVFKWGGVQSRAATPITQALRENIALRPGQTYCGSVAALLGSREVRCGVNCWSKPSSRSSPTSSNDFSKSWRSTPAARTTCSTCGGSISRPCRGMAGPVQTPPVLYSNVLNGPADAHDLTLGFPRLARISTS